MNVPPITMYSTLSTEWPNCFSYIQCINTCGQTLKRVLLWHIINYCALWHCIWCSRTIHTVYWITYLFNSVLCLKVRIISCPDCSHWSRLSINISPFYNMYSMYTYCITITLSLCTQSYVRKDLRKKRWVLTSAKSFGNCRNSVGNLVVNVFSL